MWRRFFRHLFSTRRRLQRAFTPQVLAKIEETIRLSESLHSGELRVALEAGLEWDDVAAGLTARERAHELFAELRIWDTAQNNGVLIYVLFAEQVIEIVVDRGYRESVDDEEWRALCGLATAHFAASRYEQGMVELINACGTLIARHFPYQVRDANELPNAALML